MFFQFTYCVISQSIEKKVLSCVELFQSERNPSAHSKYITHSKCCVRSSVALSVCHFVGLFATFEMYKY